MTYADIQEVMWFIPLDKIKYILGVTKSIVQVEQETYFYSMNLPISQEEITEVNRLIHQTLEYKSYITDVELRQLIDDNCPGIAINTSSSPSNFSGNFVFESIPEIMTRSENLPVRQQAGCSASQLHPSPLICGLHAAVSGP